MTDLTAKQQRFVEEYIVDLNATKAALRAGYSEKTCHAIGRENLHKPAIAAAIKAEREKLSERTHITADRVLAEIASIAFADADEDEKINATHKLRGLELLGKHLAMFSERQIHVEERPLKDQSREEIERELLERLERVKLKTIN